MGILIASNIWAPALKVRMDTTNIYKQISIFNLFQLIFNTNLFRNRTQVPECTVHRTGLLQELSNTEQSSNNQ